MQTPSATNDRAVAILRIAVGVLFLIFAQYKVMGKQFVFGGGFEYWINQFLAAGAYPFMVPVLRGFVLPHARAIAILAAVGELAIGASLTLGVAVRWASVGGLIYMLALLFSANYPGGHAPLWQYFGASLEHSVLAMCFVTFLVGDSDRVWSVAAWRRSL